MTTFNLINVGTVTYNQFKDQELNRLPCVICNQIIII